MDRTRRLTIASTVGLDAAFGSKFSTRWHRNVAMAPALKPSRHICDRVSTLSRPHGNMSIMVRPMVTNLRCTARDEMLSHRAIPRCDRRRLPIKTLTCPPDRRRSAMGFNRRKMEDRRTTASFTAACRRAARPRSKFLRTPTTWLPCGISANPSGCRCFSRRQSAQPNSDVPSSWHTVNRCKVRITGKI